MTAIATLITNLRQLSNDTPTANLISRETMKPKPDGTRKKFYVDYQDLVSGSVYTTIGNTDAGFRIQTGFTVDLANGIITFSAAPAAGSDPFTADYNFYWFTDTDYTEFLDEASKQLSVLTAEQVPSALSMALMQFGLFYFWQRRASQYASRYASTGGLSSQNVDTVTKNFRDLAKAAWDSGTKFRDDYYLKQGEQNQPAAAVFNYGISPYTPKR